MPNLGRPRRFGEEETPAIIKEAEKTGVKAVCEKYKFSPQSYSSWRYEVTGIRLKKQFPVEEKLKIPEEGAWGRYPPGLHRLPDQPHDLLLLEAQIRLHEVTSPFFHRRRAASDR